MQNRRLVLVFLVIFPMIVGLVIQPDSYSNIYTQDNDTTDLPESINYQDYDKENAFALSQDSKEGIINPVQIRESGFQTTDAVKARTDTGTNTIQNITIDEGNGWFANSTSVEVSNIKRLYGVNGTFEDGVQPWTNYTIDGGSNTQIAGYDPTEEYITCRNVGEYKWVSQHTWKHSAGSEVGFEQVVNNTEGKLNFTMRLDFRYATGPIDPDGNNGFAGVIGVFYQVDNGVTYDGWYYPMENNVGSRDAWYSLEHDFDLPAPWSEFNVVVGLYLAGDITLNNVTDYDDDLYVDGIEHAQNITLYIDNVEFTGDEAPTFENVDLTFHAGVFSEAITGSGVGTASISNPNDWTTNPLEIQITSNTTVVFIYTVTTFYHHYTNSSWTTNPNEHGVAFTVTSGQNPDLTFYTYVTSSSDYDNSTIDILYPNEWDNTTIWDPLMNNITDFCIVSPGMVHVPTSELSRSGWWRINLNGLNYAKNVSVQVFDQSIIDWSENSLFRPGNDTRVQLEIGTASVTPIEGDPVNVSWYLPNGTLWIIDSISTMVNGEVISSTWTFGSTNTTAGEWSIDIMWTNGTEIAFESVSFDLYHSASISATYPIIETDYGLTISNLITYKDADTDEFLLDDSVTIEANWSSTVISFTQNYAKNWWEADFDTSLIGGGQFTVVVTASRPYFNTVSIQFTVISIYETTLEILNAGTPIERGLNEIFTAQIEYDFLNGTGITGAQPIITFTGPAGGLSWHTFVDNDNGRYSVDIICDISATYEVTITLSKPYHYNTSDSFMLIIGETGSELELLNGTADVTLFGNSYRLVVEYRNSTGQGLPGADLQIMTVTPDTGLTYGNFTSLGNGYYEVTFTPSSAGTFSIVIGASIINHESQYTTFTLTVSGIPTILTSIPSTKTVAVNQSFTLQLRFWDESLNPIDSAIITVINPPAGIIISADLWVGNGLYNITLQSSEISTFDLLFRATADNYQSSSAGFTFVVTEIQTILNFEDDVTSTTVEFAEPFELIVYYDRLDPSASIQDANITILPGDIAELDIDIVEYTGYYIITIRGNDVGSWALTILANKTDHRVSTKSFFIEVEEIDTTVQGSSPLETLFIGCSYDFTFSFIFESNSSYIRGATISPFGAGADWVTFVELGSGQYSVNLTPQELGEHSVIVTFERVGFESASFRLTFNVGRVPITIEVLQGLDGPENSQSVVSIRISETDSGAPVSGVLVFCYIIDPNGARSIDSIALTETDTVGVYSGTISMPVAEGEYQLQITCNAADYVLNTDFTIDLEPGRDFSTMLWVTTTRYYPIILAFAALGIGLMYRRTARKNRIRENKATLAIKRRFDDIRSLMGVIVLHKESGLPIYSKILRDGLEEVVISAFITAITSFRGEFDIESSSEEWGLIPISDIIRVISTNKLVCAFITTGNPSPQQRERMIQFAKTVGFIFDETMEEVPIVVLDHHTTRQFDSLFEDILDGQLLRTYKLDDVKKFPTNSCANERIARRHGEEFKLEELATEIASCGLEEGRVYKAIMDALENHFLVTTEDSPFATELLRAPDIVEEES